MCHFGGRCLPVVDHHDKVQGLVTVFDVLKTMLKSNWNITTKGKSPQLLPLI
jgi:CBS-domain-containing membrane protein